VIKLSFSQKLWLPLVLCLLCFAGLSAIDAYRTRDVRLEERKADLVQHPVNRFNNYLAVNKAPGA
jgi:hypothetical protein